MMADANHLQQVKLALAEKYERKARAAKSDAKRKQFSRRALKYRRQAAQLTHASR